MGVWAWVAGICCSMRPLTSGLAIKCSASPAATFADVEPFCISEWHRHRRIALSVEFWAAISGVVFVGDMRAVTLADAFSAAWAYATIAAAGSHRRRDIFIHSNSATRSNSPTSHLRYSIFAVDEAALIECGSSSDCHPVLFARA